MNLKNIFEWLNKVFHIHDWKETPAVHYDGPWSERLCMEKTPATRVCSKCGKSQVRERTCLGLNPPKYIVEWYDFGAKPKDTK